MGCLSRAATSHDGLRRRGRWGLDQLRLHHLLHAAVQALPGLHGVVDLVTMNSFLYKPDGDGRGEVGKIPEAVAADAKVAHEALVELVAEGKDELMEEFFAQYLGGRSQKDVPADVAAKLKDITVDPKTVSGAVSLKGALAPWK